MNNRWSMKIVLSLWHLEEKPGRAAWRCPLHIQQQSCHLWCWNTKLKILEGNVAFCCRSLLLTILNFLDPSSKSFNSQYFPCFSKVLIHHHWKLKNKGSCQSQHFRCFPRPIHRRWDFDDRIWEMSYFWSIGSGGFRHLHWQISRRSCTLEKLAFYLWSIKSFVYEAI